MHQKPSGGRARWGARLLERSRDPIAVLGDGAPVREGIGRERDEGKGREGKGISPHLCRPRSASAMGALLQTTLSLP